MTHGAILKYKQLRKSQAEDIFSVFHNSRRRFRRRDTGIAKGELQTDRRSRPAIGDDSAQPRTKSSKRRQEDTEPVSAGGRSALSTLYTIGHSTRSLDELVAALRAHGVQTLVDIRAFPMSRRMPHFNRELLELELPKRGICYVWMKELGGHRKKIRETSPNTGLRNDSFRNYADYMLTPEFAAAIERLLEVASPAVSPKPGEENGAPHGSPPDFSATNGSDHLNPARASGNTAYMCAERVYFQCHRMLVSDYLTAHGHTVLHIDDDKRAPRLHKLMPEAHLVDGQLLYNAQQLF